MIIIFDDEKGDVCIKFKSYKIETFKSRKLMAKLIKATAC